jgi:hypothetical protein
MVDNKEIKPLRIEVEFVETDWENWKRLADFELQYRIVQEAYQKLGRGTLEGEFEFYLKHEINRYLSPEQLEKLSKSEDPPIDYLWSKLKNNIRAELVVRFLLKKRLISSVSLSKNKKEYFVMYGFNNVLLDMDTWGHDIMTLLIGRFISSSMHSDVDRILRATARLIPEDKLNPRNMIRLRGAVLDLTNLSLVRLEDVGDYFFDYAMPVFTSSTNLDELKLAIRDIQEDRYDIRLNKVYQFFRPRFSDEDWEYLVTGLGVIMSPYREKLLMIIVGEPHSGKSTLLSLIRKPIEPLVSSVSLSDMLRYEFGLEPLIGKYVWISSEKSELYITRVHILNLIFGESDTIEVARKHKPHARLTSLKLGIMGVNDPPIIEEKVTGTADALLERISIVTMVKPEDAVNVKGLVDMISAEEVFNFLLWCRRQLEKNDWKVKKLPKEDIVNILKETTNTATIFLEESPDIITGKDYRIEGQVLYALYVKWCGQKGVKPMTKNLFYAVLRERGLETYKREGVVWVKGVGQASKDIKNTSALYELTKFEN